MGEIRLADRRGKLTGDLSRVQEWALRLILAWEHDRDSIRRTEATANDLRLAILMNGGSQSETMVERFRRLYPELVQPVTDVTDVTDVTEEDLEDPEGDWDFSQVEMDQDDVEDVLRQLGTMQTVSFAHFGDSEGWH